jgi:hypothetical protein
MSHYETTFEHQRLPLGMEFTDEAITFMKDNDEFVKYYHNYYQEDSHFQSFREMVDERIHLEQIIRNKGLHHSTSIILFNMNYCVFSSPQINGNQVVVLLPAAIKTKIFIVNLQL